ncbi:MAG: methyltransferase family protein, partial [Bryobacteraceae bacterium]
MATSKIIPIQAADVQSPQVQHPELQRPEVQDFERLMQLSTGLVFTAALQPIARLKIADLLADGPQPVAQLATASGTNADALYRVMRLLASVGVFAEMPGKVFALTPVSHLLRSDVPGSMRDMVLWISNPFHFQVHGELGYSVLTGKPAVEKVYGKP